MVAQEVLHRLLAFLLTAAEEELTLITLRITLARGEREVTVAARAR
jgi:hypothetical protein